MPVSAVCGDGLRKEKTPCHLSLCIKQILGIWHVAHRSNPSAERNDQANGQRKYTRVSRVIGSRSGRLLAQDRAADVFPPNDIPSDTIEGVDRADGGPNVEPVDKDEVRRLAIGRRALLGCAAETADDAGVRAVGA